MTVFLDRIHTATLDAAAVAAFGVGTRILDSRLLGLGMSHVVYRVLIDRPPGACVFRFSRGVTDTFDNEIANFAAVSRLTGVRGPDIYAIDKSCSHSTTPFMAMEYLVGTEWSALCGENPSQRDRIRAQVGEFYARLHSETFPRAAADKPNLILGIEQLTEDAAGYLDLDGQAVLHCVEVARQLITDIDTCVLCFSDGELYFDADRFRPAFVLDLQWMQRDLAAVDICTHIDDHFLRGYTRTAGIALDTTFLSRLAVCRELSSWGFIATEAASRTRIPWIQSQRPRITDIMEEIQRAR